MTTLTSTTTTSLPPRTSLASIVREPARVGRVKAAAFGAIAYFGLSFAQALIVPGDILVLGQLAALAVGILAAGRLTDARDRRTWLVVVGSVVAAIAVIGLAMWAVVAFVIWGPLAP